MKFFFGSLSAALMLLLLSEQSHAFSRHAFLSSPPTTSTKTTSSSSSTSTTSLYISSWGIKGANKWGGSPTEGAAVAELERKKMNPEEKIQAYLDPPEPVEARDHIDGTVLVSGLVNNKERTDQFVFDLLNHEDSAFEFSKIVAFCDDVKFAKKRLLSRSARYTGLLDKLDFAEAPAPGGLPTLEQLKDVKAWVAVLEKDDADVGGKALLTEQIPMLAQLAQQTPTLHHLAILVSKAFELDLSYRQSAVQALEAAAGNDRLKYTLIAVGALNDQGEGKMPYAYQEFADVNSTLPATTVFSREESLRLITEFLQLESGVNRTLFFREVYNVNATESKLIKGLREAGYARPQEIDHMIRLGPQVRSSVVDDPVHCQRRHRRPSLLFFLSLSCLQAYLKAIDEWKTGNPDAAMGYATTDAWWEDPKFARKGKSFEEEQKDEQDKVKDDKTKEIEQIAREWAKREFFRERMGGTLAEDITEADYIQSVWDRALKEGDIKYRKMRGEVTEDDAEKELEDFKTKQERKKQTMLKKAKSELAELLEQEDLGGDDIKAKLLDSEEEDDEDEDDN